MPKAERFRTPEDFHHTLFHEAIHATGHASRLGREGITNPIKFGSDRYSKEELIAELGAAFLSNEAGILDQVLFENSASYLGSWIRNLEQDPTLIVSAASQGLGVLLRRDRYRMLLFYLGPFRADNHRLEEPAHGEGEVLHPSQVMVG